MKAIQITEFGGPEVMNYLDLPDPVPGADEVLLDVTSIGINYADTHQTENSYLSPQTLPMIPGIEVVGTYDGKRYLTSVSSGGYAQKAVAHQSVMIPIPDSVSDQDALCMLVQGSTAWHLLKTMGHIEKGQSVVVHAAAGGVGTIAIQLAKLWGATVIAVTSSVEKAELAKQLGADHVVDAASEDLSKAIRDANGGRGVNLILEMVGGKTFDQSLLALGTFGKLITFGMASRTAPTPIHPGALMHGSKTVAGFWLANCFGKKELFNDVIEELFTLISDGKLKPVIGATYPLSQAQAAHKSMLARESVGKIALDPAL
ncbi:Qor NADPH,quinone reductase and related Zn-dependent oxidoreductases [Candidatus Nanopelagicaceae bacterium]